MNQMNGSHKVGKNRLENMKLESTERSWNELKWTWKIVTEVEKCHWTESFLNKSSVGYTISYVKSNFARKVEGLEPNKTLSCIKVDGPER